MSKGLGSRCKNLLKMEQNINKNRGENARKIQARISKIKCTQGDPKGEI